MGCVIKCSRAPQNKWSFKIIGILMALPIVMNPQAELETVATEDA